MILTKTDLKLPGEVRVARRLLARAVLGLSGLGAGMACASPEAETEPEPPPAHVSTGADGSARGGGGSEETVPLTRIRLVDMQGLTALDADQLVREVGPVDHRRWTLSEMRGLAADVQRRLREAGRPFAQAYLPAQDLRGGELRIAVVEGRYGKVSINGELAGQAAPWLDDLKPGAPLGTELNARLRLLSEQPGVRAVAVLSPGDDIGEGDVAIEVRADRRFVGGLRLDNHGNAYAGQVRLTGQAAGQSLWRLGDRAGLVLGANSGHGWQGALSYALPVGHRGVRVGGSLSHHRYQLGKDFKALEASGDVNAADLQLSWPIHRSAALRLEGQVALELQRIRHLRGAVHVDDRRRSSATQLAINGSGAGSAVAAAGRLWMDAGALTLLNAAQLKFDAATARTAGHFGRLGGDVSAIVPLGRSTMFLRGAGQWSRANLDSSKKFVLGGADGVRAWSSGDGAGDDAALLQVEVRHRLGLGEPFVFADIGRVRVNHQPWTDDPHNTRQLAGAGLGLRLSHLSWSLESLAAWRIGGGTAVSPDASKHRPQFWLSVRYAL